ncbi:MAG: superoxide dismutase [Flammeovirgaceae bacterium]|nr:superoxide dismutase [Flammeovirgaceae bacterium]
MKSINRRKFIKKSISASATTLGATFLLADQPVFASTPQNNFEFQQLKLPYSYDALEKSIDKMTMEIHYTKHHAAYVLNVNAAIQDEKIVVKSEKEFFSGISKRSSKARNNGGGAYNHNLFWTCMTPSTGTPSGKIADAINGAFGSFDKFKELFTQASLSRFGSGWVWLVKENGKLQIGSTPNQDNPLMDASDFKGIPLLALDVWEHAYYLKYQNKRSEYVANWWNVVNWETVAERLG